MRIFWPLFVRAAKLPDCAPPVLRRSGVLPDGVEQAVTFENNSPWTLEIVWMDFEGSPHQIDPNFVSGSEHRENTHTAHVFEFRLFGKTIDYVEVSRGVDVHRVDACQLPQDVAEKDGYYTHVHVDNRFLKRDGKVDLPHVDTRQFDFDSLVITDLACNHSVRDEKWMCLQPAPSRASWPKERYGFQPDEAKATGSYRKPFQTEDQMDQLKPPKFSKSESGYLVLKMPDELFQVVKTAYEHGRISQEKPPGMHYSNSGIGAVQWNIVSLDAMIQTRTWVAHFVHAIADWWVDFKYHLEFKACYGIREYQRNAMLIDHRDTTATHIISAILQVDQEAEEGWPLYIEDHKRSGGTKDTTEYNEVYLQPGYMLLYEGARYFHGRPRRFNGTRFANIFVHFKPTLWNLNEVQAKVRKRHLPATYEVPMEELVKERKEM
jgi:hypothetical protein